MILKLLKNEFIFLNSKNLIESNLVLFNHLFGNEKEIQSMLIKIGLKKLSLKPGTVIGNVIVLNTKDGGS